MERLLYAIGLDPKKTKLVNSVMKNGKSILYVESDNIKYKIENAVKTIIEDNNHIVKDIEPKPEKVESGVVTKKPKGWHFRAIYVDTNGDVYFKGKIQPELKDKYDQEGKLI